MFACVGMGLLLTGCKKELDLDYHTISALYVAEGSVTQDGTTVLLSTSQDITDNTRSEHAVSGATVVVSVPDLGISQTLKDEGKGRYTSTLKGIPGNTYQLDIDVDGRHFTSTSTMQEMPVVGSYRFVWRKMMTESMLFLDLRLQDIPNQNNYYFMHIYRNNLGYRWAVKRDDTNPGGELQQLFNCATKRDIEDGSSDAPADGDRIRLEIRTIDKAAYDYLYSMQVMDNAGTNPIQNFSGGCLGYFSAYSVQNLHFTFRLSDVEEDD